MKNLDIQLSRIKRTNYHTSLYGLARSFLAVSLLITLLFNDKRIFFVKELFLDDNPDFINRINFFKLFGYDNLGLGVFCASVVLLWTISGYFPQINCLFHFWVSNSFLRAAALIDGGDQINSNLCLLLIPIALTDRRINHWFIQEKNQHLYMKIIAHITFFAIAIQMSLLYFHAAICKMQINEWINGSACYYWFSHSVFGVSDSFRDFFLWLMADKYVVTFFTWGTILLEILLFMAILFNKRYKKLFLSFGIIFHLLIILIHGLVSFGLSMFAGLYLYLYPKTQFFNFKIEYLWKRKKLALGKQV